MPAGPDSAGSPQGLSWSWELDFATLMAAISDDDAAGAPAASGGLPAVGSRDHDVALEVAPAGAADFDGADDPDVIDHSDGVDDPGRRGGELVLAGRVAERLLPGPDLAAWLATAPPAGLGDADLAATAGSWRRLASWATAQELAAVAQIAARTAARDQDIGTGADGRPQRIPASAAAEVALELTMSQYGAAGWADLAVTLRWRLPGTAAALSEGVIDVYRARLITEATGLLSDQAARAVEERVLPAAGGQTPGMLRAALRRAVIAADPKAAEERRKETERRAKVSLYPDQDNTAALAGQRLPAVHAAAAMARIKAMARAMKAAGAGGSVDLLCAQVFLGLLLGTQPLIPPAKGAPPDPPESEDPPGSGPEDLPGGGPGNPGGPPGSGPCDPGHGGPGDHADRRPRGDGSGNDGSGRDRPGGQDGARGGPSHSARLEGSPRDRGPGDNRPTVDGPGDDWPDDEDLRDDAPGDDGPGDDGPGDDWPDDEDLRDDAPGDDGPGDDGPGEVPGAGVPPPPGDADAPRPDDDPGPADGGEAGHGQPGDAPPGDDEDDGRPAWAWPDLPAVIPPALARPAGGRAAPGLLDLSVPWRVLAGTSEGPGHLGRIGPVTATQARQLAGCAARDPGTEWRIILTSPAGYAIAVTRIPGQAAPPAGRPGTPGRGRGLAGRVTLTIPEDLLAHPPPPPPPPASGTGTRAGPGPGSASGARPAAGAAPGPGSASGARPGSGAGATPGPGSGATPGPGSGATPGPGSGAGSGAGGWPGPPGPILRLALRAAARAAARARAAAAADTAAGGCAHTAASPGYRPPPRLRDHITARDLTCRNPRCRQPARHADLDHTIPYDDGGLTCTCNLGGFCRTDHLLKHHPGWKVAQTTPGTFTWTTPSGRTFTTTPDTHPT